MVYLMNVKRYSYERSSPKISGREEPSLAGIRTAVGKTAVKALLLAEKIRLDPIGQGIEAAVRDSEHPLGGMQHVAG